MNDPLRVIWGALVGDACGAPLEFYHGTITEMVARHAMTMKGGGKLRIGPGQITDDGELTLALWGVLQGRDPMHGFPLELVAKAYGAWYESFPFDIGRTCSLAFEVLSEWMEDSDTCRAIENVLEQIKDLSHSSEANGAIMRVTPVAAWWASHPFMTGRAMDVVDVEKTAHAAAYAAAMDACLSHPGRVAQEANAIYVYALVSLLLGSSPAETIARVESMVCDRCETLQHWMEESKSEWECLSDAQVLIGHLRHAFVAAFWFLRRPEIGYAEAICRMLQRGGDTDTNAAIVGGMVSCYQPIPEEMRGAVADFDCVVEGRQRPPEYGVKYGMSGAAL